MQAGTSLYGRYHSPAQADPGHGGCGQYFTINRARQYGKTTTIRALGRYLEKDYLVVSLDFQKEMSAAKFSDENTFSLAFAKAFLLKIENSSEHIDGAFGVAVEELKRKCTMAGAKWIW